MRNGALHQPELKCPTPTQVNLLAYQTARDMGISDEVLRHYGIQVPGDASDEASDDEILAASGPVAEAVEINDAGSSSNVAGSGKSNSAKVSINSPSSKSFSSKSFTNKEVLAGSVISTDRNGNKSMTVSPLTFPWHA